MRRHALRLFALLPLLALILALAGCASRSAAPALPAAAPAEPGAGVLVRDGKPVQVGTFNIDRALVIAGDGAVAETRRLTATDQFAEYWRSQIAAMRGALRRGWVLQAQDEGGRVVITMSRTYGSFEEFNRETGGQIEVVEHPLFQKVIFKQSMVYDPDVLATEVPAPGGVAREEWVKFLGTQVRWSQRVTLPGRVTSHNMDAASGNTVEWARTAGSLAGQTDFTAETRVFRTVPLALTGTAALLLIGGPIAVRLTRRWWDPDRE